MNEAPKSTNIKDVADAVKAITENVPVYNDLVQPAANEIGKGLQTVAKLIHVALSPIQAVVWSYGQIEQYLTTTLEEKLKRVPKENIQTPDAHVVGPAIEALRFTAKNEELKRMYMNLIANSMDSETANAAHPAFVDIIKNMNSDEAKLLKYLYENGTQALVNFYYDNKDRSQRHLRLTNMTNMGIEDKLSSPNFSGIYIENLKRLGLLEVPAGQSLFDESTYEQIFETELFKKLVAEAQEDGNLVRPEKLSVNLTSFGDLFCYACISDKENQEDQENTE